MSTEKIYKINKIIEIIRNNGFRVMIVVFNATFNNMSVISWRSTLFVEETGVPGENNRHAAGH